MKSVLFFSDCYCKNLTGKVICVEKSFLFMETMFLLKNVIKEVFDLWFLSPWVHHNTRKSLLVFVCVKLSSFDILLILSSLSGGGGEEGGKELGWPVYCITSLTSPPSQSWQQHYCYWPLLFLSLFDWRSWNNTKPLRCCNSSGPVDVCGQSVIIRQTFKFFFFPPASSPWSLLDLKPCARMMMIPEASSHNRADLLC